MMSRLPVPTLDSTFIQSPLSDDEAPLTTTRSKKTMGEETAATAEKEAGSGGACEFCGEAPALVHCRADSARLCLACDRHVHAANTVSSRHSRALLCDACRTARATILCASHNSMLCPNCDFDAHQDAAQQHDRRPVEPYSGCPTAVELVDVLGVGGDGKEIVGGGDEGFGEDGWVWEAQPILSLEDYIVPTTSCHGFQALGLVPLNKNRKAACGKHREEILRQLRELMKSESYVATDCWQQESAVEFIPMEQEQILQEGNMEFNLNQDTTCFNVPTYEVNFFQWDHSDNHDPTHTMAFPFEQFTGSSLIANPTKTEEAGDIDASANQVSGSGGGGESGDAIIKEKILSLPKRSGYDLALPDRDSVLSRYKEKRKARRYDKLIRYESRKARADSRVRIKGRFAKANQAEK
ncbi:Zinc finger RING/FYVE/PHD-type protein [Dioscorea alata]|uniref:Zinc finger RING/FYVE/PHD-type protein n=1 Tax=Dioscorea alata TaxID=55571 RepID=A0ACB7VQP2_DIOAL|nr:Zinc finger RING/FYVE/PHD-type protein [Dioscorea alata]